MTIGPVCFTRVGEEWVGYRVINKLSDVNIPDIETCRVCHAGNVRTAKREVSTCEACHGFHLPGHAPMQKGADADARHHARAAASVGGPAAAP